MDSQQYATGPEQVQWTAYDAGGQAYPDLTGLSVSASAAGHTPSPPIPQPLATSQQQPQQQQPQQHASFQYATHYASQEQAAAGWHSYETQNTQFELRRPSSRSTSSSEKSLGTKRSLSALTPLSVSVEENEHGGYEHEQQPQSAVDLRTPGGTMPFDDHDMHFAHDMLASPLDGDPHNDDAKPIDGVLYPGPTSSSSASNSLAASTNNNNNNKPHPANNFVSKLYQMITDPKAAQYITWTELGTSFVVSSVGEFSRTILGSHFKHNNFSSFVRQLNMYGFHKINRTPRAQRTSTDQQVWEFSHHKFLRGRPDLLDDIKRKAIDTEPATVARTRVELPADVNSQLSRMSDEYRTVVRELQAERAKVERLTNIVKSLYDVMAANFPGQLAGAFPADLLESHPPIYITSPTDSRPQQSLSAVQQTNGYSLGTGTLSPSSSPTSVDFPPAQFNGTPPGSVHTNGLQQAGHTQRRPLLHRVSFDQVPGQTFGGAFQSTRRPGHESAGTTLPSSPSGVSSEEYGQSPTMAPGTGPRAPNKRPRPNDSMQVDQVVDGSGTMRRIARARSDSAPLGYGHSMNGMGGVGHWEGGGRPRSGSTRHGPGPRTTSSHAIPQLQQPPPPPPPQHQTPMDFTMAGIMEVPQLIMPGQAVAMAMNGAPPPVIHIPPMKEEAMHTM